MVRLHKFCSSSTNSQHRRNIEYIKRSFNLSVVINLCVGSSVNRRRAILARPLILLHTFAPEVSLCASTKGATAVHYLPSISPRSIYDYYDAFCIRSEFG